MNQNIEEKLEEGIYCNSQYDFRNNFFQQTLWKGNISFVFKVILYLPKVFKGFRVEKSRYSYRGYLIAFSLDQIDYSFFQESLKRTIT